MCRPRHGQPALEWVALVALLSRHHHICDRMPLGTRQPGDDERIRRVEFCVYPKWTASQENRDDRNTLLTELPDQIQIPGASLLPGKRFNISLPLGIGGLGHDHNHSIEL